MTESMDICVISHPDCKKHEMILGHPEAPERIEAIQERLQDGQIINHVKNIDAPKIDKKLLYSVHDKKYIDKVFAKAPLLGLSSLDPDTYMNPYTLDAALRAAGSVIHAVSLVLGNKSNRVFCNVRPPGHHASRNAATGFCFFNNVALGAIHSIKNYNIKRVAIIDFDVHQGDGTIDIVKGNPKIFYATSHQHPYYPYSDSVEAFNILEIPIEAYTTGDLIREQYKNHILPRLDKFKPEIIFISAGFDGYYLDSIADIFLTEYDYYWITQELVKIANKHSGGKVISVLEGGYKIPELGDCVLAHCWALLEKNITNLYKIRDKKKYPFCLSEWVSLKKNKILIRPIQICDKNLYEQFFSLLSIEDIRRRFFIATKKFSEHELNSLVDIDYEKVMAFVALSYSKSQVESMLGIIRFVLDTKTNAAEFSICIRSDIQGVGLGYTLMQRMIRYCRLKKFHALRGEIMKDNEAMINLARNLGFSIHSSHHDSSVLAELDLNSSS